jgi:hypothetical protein
LDLHRVTAGNPFFVTEVLASGSDAIPATVRDAVLARAARLSTDARALLGAIAIAPPQVELWLLDALAGEHVSALEECLSSGMLVEHAASGISFRHELARLAIEESLEPRRRLSLHRTALAALSEPPDALPDAARLAHHADASGHADAVLRHAPVAAERASAVDAPQTAEHYARVLRLRDRLSATERAEYLERRSRACYSPTTSTTRSTQHRRPSNSGERLDSTWRRASRSPGCLPRSDGGRAEAARRGRAAGTLLLCTLAPIWRTTGRSQAALALAEAR